MVENYSQDQKLIQSSRGFKEKVSLWPTIDFNNNEDIIPSPKEGFEPWPLLTRKKIKEDKAVWVKTHLTVDVFQKTFLLNRKLTSVHKAIQSSKSILDLKDDWDEDGALPCKPITYTRAIEFLVRYANEVLVSHNISIDYPEINLAKDGSIDLEWRNENYILLINILSTEKLDIHYYGEDSKSKTIIKGFIDYNSINKDLTFWMQKLA